MGSNTIRLLVAEVAGGVSVCGSSGPDVLTTGFQLVHAAVRRRSVSGPIGALCSGGNDSSSNVVLLSRQGANPLHTFTVGLAEFEGDSKYNDLHYARQVAEYAKSQHHESLLSPTSS